MIVLDTQTHAKALNYMACTFLTKPQLQEELGQSGRVIGKPGHAPSSLWNRVQGLMKAGCAPGAIYGYHQTHGW